MKHTNSGRCEMYQFGEITLTPSFNLNTTKSYTNASNLSSYESRLSISSPVHIYGAIEVNFPDTYKFSQKHKLG